MTTAAFKPPKKTFATVKKQKPLKKQIPILTPYTPQPSYQQFKSPGEIRTFQKLKTITPNQVYYKDSRNLPKRNAGSVRAVNRSGTLNFKINHMEKKQDSEIPRRMMTPKATRFPISDLNFRKTPPPRKLS